MAPAFSSKRCDNLLFCFTQSITEAAFPLLPDFFDEEENLTIGVLQRLQSEKVSQQRVSVESSFTSQTDKLCIKN